MKIGKLLQNYKDATAWKKLGFPPFLINELSEFITFIFLLCRTCLHQAVMN